MQNSKGKKKENVTTIDLRDIQDNYWNPNMVYSNEEAELFKKPTQFKHFKHRIDLLIKRNKENKLIFLDKGDGILYLAIKLYVLNLVPTKDEDLSNQIYKYLYNTFGIKEFKKIIAEYADYIKLRVENDRRDRRD